MHAAFGCRGAWRVKTLAGSQRGGGQDNDQNYTPRSVDLTVGYFSVSVRVGARRSFERGPAMRDCYCRNYRNFFTSAEKVNASVRAHVTRSLQSPRSFSFPVLVPAVRNTPAGVAKMVSCRLSRPRDRSKAACQRKPPSPRSWCRNMRTTCRCVSPGSDLPKSGTKHLVLR